MPNKALKTGHSLFAGTAATLDISKLARRNDIKDAIAQSTQIIIERSAASESRILYEAEARLEQLNNTLSSFQEEVLLGFSFLGDSLTDVTVHASLGNTQTEQNLAVEKQAFVRQRRQVGTVDTGALQSILAGFGEEISQKINASVTQILSTASPNTSQVSNNDY
jgi:hypothetical protein